MANNGPDYDEVDVEVCISVVMSRTARVTVPRNYTEYDLEKAVNEQIYNPLELMHLEGRPITLEDESSKWTIDNISVVE